MSEYVNGMDWCGFWDGEKRGWKKEDGNEKDVGEIGKMAKPVYDKRRMPRPR